jgi:diguanylate cyclase (GGDEF)-like protein
MSDPVSPPPMPRQPSRRHLLLLRLGVRSLRTKLMATVLVVSVGSLGVGLMALHETESVYQQGRSIYTEALVPNQVLSDLHQNVVQARFDVLSRANAVDKAAYIAANAALHSDERNIAELTATYASEGSLTPMQKGLLATFNRTWVRYEFVRDHEVTPALVSGNKALYEKLRTTVLVPLVNKALGVLNVLTADAQNAAKARLGQADSASSTARTSILVLLVVMVLLSTGLARAIANAIMRPVLEVRDILDAVAQNDLTRTADVRTSDELGQMASSLNTSISHLRSLHQSLSEQALRDPLTGLLNRSAFLTYLATELTFRASTTAVLFIDLDGFKSVNDTEGHAAGDALLITASERIRETVRGTDLVARLGGDEFVVICTGVDSPDVAAAASSRIMAKLTSPFDIGGREVVIGASIGISIATSASSPGEMLNQADAAMYQSKANGKAQQTFFDASMMAER